jgi:hypothetical protein
VRVRRLGETRHATPIEACVRSFVERQPMRAPDASVRVVGQVALFDVTYGEPHDCEAGCFRSHAFGAATSCDRIGWLLVSDREHTRVSDVKMFVLAPTDTALFDESLWTKDTTRSLARWLARNPNASDDIQARASAWLANNK